MEEMHAVLCLRMYEEKTTLSGKTYLSVVGEGGLLYLDQ